MRSPAKYGRETRTTSSPHPHRPLRGLRGLCPWSAGPISSGRAPSEIGQSKSRAFLCLSAAPSKSSWGGQETPGGLARLGGGYLPRPALFCHGRPPLPLSPSPPPSLLPFPGSRTRHFDATAWSALAGYGTESDGVPGRARTRRTAWGSLSRHPRAAEGTSTRAREVQAAFAAPLARLRNLTSLSPIRGRRPWAPTDRGGGGEGERGDSGHERFNGSTAGACSPPHFARDPLSQEGLLAISKTAVHLPADSARARHVGMP